MYTPSLFLFFFSSSLLLFFSSSSLLLFFSSSLLLFFSSSLFFFLLNTLSLDDQTRYVYALLHPVLPETYDQTHLRRKSRSMKTQLTHRLQRGMTRSHVLSIQHAIR